jgi:hypothetical protein
MEAPPPPIPLPSSSPFPIVSSPAPQTSESYADEIWKSLEFYGFPVYEISNYGRCRNSRTGYILKGYENKAGYVKYHLIDTVNGNEGGLFAHRLVLEAFVGPANGHTGDHINQVKNDNKLINLRWATPKMQRANQDKSKPRTTSGGRPVYRLDPVTEAPLERFRTIEEALATKLYPTHRLIRECCKDRTKTYKGFKWAYCQDLDVIPGEEWRIVPNKIFKDIWASNKGRIARNGKLMGCSELCGYMRVAFRDENKEDHSFSVHRLVMAAFYGERDDLVVNHKDGNGLNDYLENLEYTTQLGNVRHWAWTEGTDNGIKPVIQMTMDGAFVARYASTGLAEKMTGLSRLSIWRACTGINEKSGEFKWKYADD